MWITFFVEKEVNLISAIVKVSRFDLHVCVTPGILRYDTGVVVRDRVAPLVQKERPPYTLETVNHSYSNVSHCCHGGDGRDVYFTIAVLESLLLL
ncbi:hypothetical protein J7E79_24160 [Bacillus sp. ISL-40]|uniref:hypothetical protein n=1 Tax=Bacillus sp. ISL-40 TaxID=2819126 RepID=UPI001BE69421|nr:hypothetical protein [Bacillus sp. ISL-40]MBT2700435.1 hypothetical protein [Bacillus sp. ISL-40]